MKGLLIWCLLALLAFAKPLPVPAPEAILKDLEYPDQSKGYLLAFRSQVDDRPLYVDYALLAVKLPNGWSLCHAYRHPEDSPQWHLSVVYDADVTPQRSYKQRPSLKEVKQFIHDSWWSFGATDGFHLTRSQIDEQAWRDSLGFPPPFKFKKS